MGKADSFRCLLFITAICAVAARHYGPILPKCKFGKYIKDINQPPTCDKSAVLSCPSGFSCGTGRRGNRGLGFCCLENNPCLSGVPFRVRGDAVHCDGGPGAVRCRKGYKCTRVGTPASAYVCCPDENSNQCPNGEPIFNCFANPCDVTECLKYPSAVCKADYCGGCHARFYNGNTEVKC